MKKSIISHLLVALFTMLPASQAFALFPFASLTRQHLSNVPFANDKRLWATSDSSKFPPPAKTNKEEKLTKEAKELQAILVEKKKDATSHLVVAQIAPATRLAFPEEFGEDPGTFTPEILVSSLKELGFDLVLDTNTAADLTIIEEGTELLHRLKAQDGKERGLFCQGNPGPDAIPLFTSCCPGWMQLVEKSLPEVAPYVSTCKSPQIMFGAYLKAYCEELFGLPPEKVYFTSIMPCVRKRGESDQAAFDHGEYREVDNVITTKDLGALLRTKGIDPHGLEPKPFDSPFQKDDGRGTGAGQLFGASGGVTEAAVRSVYELVTGQQMERLELDAVRGFDNVKEAIVPLHNGKLLDNGMPDDLRIAVVHGLGNVKKLIQKMKDGEVEYDFVEVMACPGGCIGGGGQPRGAKDSLDKRLELLYNLDRSLPRRRCHDNPTVKAFYEKHLGEFGGERAHELLHVEPVYGRVPVKAK